MRTDRLYLADITEAAEDIQRFIGTTTENEFVGHDMMKSAVLQKLMVIGEAASRISAELTARHPEIPWRDIAGFRNIAVHAYLGSVDWRIVWATATKDVPALAEQILALQH
ncbi:MAG: hypothetical protein A3H93_19495 [Rhodocyclales bacterium RIFCSPLOWO2_02_FULL_63_24]|nr:MAG: hypothetical protein A3H93_19495 [Rhodocyclales bacterium RIFCSPLOWO2_02_FULL_63_24]